MVKEPPIAFAIHLVDGRTITSQELRVRVLVSGFWFLVCFCLLSFYGATSITLNKPETRNQKPEDAARGRVVVLDFWATRGGYTIPLAWDGGAALENAFALHGFPALLVLDGEGQVRMRHVGFLGGEDLEGTLLRAIDSAH